MDNCPCQFTSAELDVLAMAAGDLPWESGEWVEVCLQFLQKEKFISKAKTLTNRGLMVYGGIDTMQNPVYNKV